MATPTAVDSLLRCAAIAFIATSILVTAPFAVAQTQPTVFIAADSADSLNPSESTGNDAQLADDSAIRTKSQSRKTPPADVHGAWCGPLNDNFFHAGTISIVLTQNGSKLAGNWSTSLVGGGGTLRGKIKGDSLTLTLRQQDSPCRALVHGTLVQTGEVTGNYTIFGCQQSDGGTFDITSPDC